MYLGRSLDEWRNLLKNENEPLRLYAARALAEMGLEALPALVEALGHKEAPVRYWAATGLGNIGPNAKQAIPALSQALEDASASVRTSAALALWKIDHRSEAITALVEVLKDPSSAARLRAVQTLGGIGPDAKQAFPAVEAALKDQDGYVKRAAEQAVKDVNP